MQNKHMRFLIRLYFLYLTITCFYEMRMHFAYIPLTARLCLRWLFMSLLMNIGVFLSSIKNSRKYKMFFILLYAPSILLVPIFITTGGTAGNIIHLIIAVILLWLTLHSGQKNEKSIQLKRWFKTWNLQSHW